MRIDLGPLRVNRVIAHEVPNRPTGSNALQVVHSEVESALTQALRNYFREKAIGSLGSAGYDVESDSQISSPVPALLSNYLQGNGSDFISMSQEVADHLYNSQTGVNSAGLLCVMEVDISGVRGVAILKLDKDEAVHIEQIDLNGSATFDFRHLRDLILTTGTKVFKAGLFTLQESSNEIEGLVSDNQRGYTTSSEVADFFLKAFLGCKLVESPAVATKRFFNTSEGFITHVIPDSVAKAQYETALLAELNNNRGTLNPGDFSERNLQLEDRQLYREWFHEQDVEFQEFDKDVQLIKRRLRRVSVNFESGVSVLVPPDSLGEQVQMSDMVDGLTRMEIEDRLTNVEGKP